MSKLSPKQKELKERLSAKYRGKSLSTKFSGKFLKNISIIILIALIALVAIYVHGILFGSYIPWDVKKKIILPWQLFWGFSMCWTPVLVVIITRLLLGDQGPHGADMGDLRVLIVMGIVIGAFILMFMENYIKTPDLKDMHKPTPKEIYYGGEWRRGR